MDFKNIIHHKVDGEALPQESQGKGDPSKRKKLLVLWGVIFVLLYIAIHMWWIIYELSANSKGGLPFVMEKVNYLKLLLISLNPFYKFVPLDLLGISVLGSLILTMALSMKINFAGKQVAYGQKGDSRLTTQKEIEEQFKAIPDHEKPFKGYGGIPISHYKGKYYIDTATNHTVVVGTSRSGKGQTEVNPMIDILSRAEKKCSMIINDPKKELFGMANDVLIKRGYHVYLFNMADPSNSMGYNPLQLVIEKWEQNDKETAIQLINSISYTLFHEKKAGSNAWVYKGAQSAVNGMIIALIEYCMNPKNFEDHKKHPERVTMNNIIDMTNELMIDYVKDENNPFKTSLILDEYFKSLPQGSFAKTEYSSMAVAPEKGKSSIVQTILERLNMFMMPKMARMTSANSLELKSIGFPKYLSFKVGKDFNNKRLFLRFYHAKTIKDSNGKIKRIYNKKYDTQFVIGVKYGGFVEYNFATKLHTGDKLEIAYLDTSTGKEKASSWFMTLYDDQKKPKLAKNMVKFTDDKFDLGVDDLQMYYDEKPTAVFLNLPDYDPSNNALASIFINQLYSELAKECSNIAGGKTLKRVQFVLDEAGNMDAINDMDHIMTVSAGRNILFNLFFQSYKQMDSVYGKEVAATIKENCQNQILIKTTDYQTLEEFSNLAGNYTVEGGSVNKDKMNVATNYSASADSVKLLTVERLSQMMKGEDLVLRPLTSQDLKGRNVRPYPIFNKGDHAMPFAYKLLANTFDSNADPNLIKVDAPHVNLDLKSLAINWEDFTLFDEKAHKAFLEHTSSEAAKRSQNNEEHSGAETASSSNENSGKTEEEILKEKRKIILSKSIFIKHVDHLYKTDKLNKQTEQLFEKAYLDKDHSLMIQASNSLDKNIAEKLGEIWNREVKS